MKIYMGYRGLDGPRVRVFETDGASASRALEMRWDLWNHSPDGPEWGYGGSGPAQLALAILADVLANDRAAVKLHQAYKRAVIGCLNRLCWLVYESDVLEWAARELGTELEFDPDSWKKREPSGDQGHSQGGEA